MQSLDRFFTRVPWLEYLKHAWNFILKSYTAILPQWIPDDVSSTVMGDVALGPPRDNTQFQVVGLSVPSGAGAATIPNPDDQQNQLDTAPSPTEDDWSRETDPTKRRRIQNRLAQRRYRKLKSSPLLE
jgi:hypothetical protein